MDAIEKTITLDELDEKEGFPSADADGYYKLTDLKKFIKVKGTKPEFDENAKICLKKGAITSITEITIDGYKMEFKDGKLTINGKAVEKKKKKKKQAQHKN